MQARLKFLAPVIGALVDDCRVAAARVLRFAVCLIGTDVTRYRHRHLRDGDGQADSHREGVEHGQKSHERENPSLRYVAACRAQVNNIFNIS